MDTTIAESGQLWPWLIPGLPLMGALLTGAMHIAGLRRPKNGDKATSEPLAATIAILAMAAAFAFSIKGFLALRGGEANILSTSYDWIPTGDFTVSWSLMIDHLSSLMTLVVTGVGLLIHIYAAGYMKGDAGYAKFFAYLNLFVAAMLMLVLSDNMVGTFVGWEGVGLCSYLLIGFWYQDGWRAEAAQKAFVVNRIGDAAFLMGMFILATTLGSLDYSVINSEAILLAQPELPWMLSLAALLLFGGACGKSAQIPLFVWLPDAMAGPTPVSALIHAATMVTSGVYLVVRLNPLFAAAPLVLTLIGAIGAATAFVAGTSALRQRDLKGVLAYSTISQLGYMFLALGVGAFSSAIFHLVTHAFFKALLFLAAGSVIHGMHGEQDIHKMGGLKTHMPKTCLTFIAGAAALSGLPLMSGFFSKDEILAQAFAGGGVSLILWAVGLVTAAITATYTWRMVALVFFGKERFDKQAVHPHESGALMTTPLFILALLSVAGGILGLPIVFHAPHILGEWLAPVVEPGQAILAAAHNGHLSHLAEWILLGLGAMIALGCAHLAFHAHRQGTQSDLAFETKNPELALSLSNAWGVDRAYQVMLVQPVMTAASAISTLFDLALIDGAVNGLGRFAQRLGERVSRQASGHLGAYGLTVGGAACALAAIWMWIGA
jgi:NADH-quinone oxidoreductase subunit L